MELRENIAAAEPTAIVPRTFAEAQAFASALCASDLVPQALRDNAPNVLMMILAGAEIHVPPIASMRIFHVIEGVPKLSADGIAAICTRDPSCEYLEPEEMSSTKVTWIAKKKGRPEKRLTITREEMIAAGLYDRKNRDGSPGNHQKYPRQMLNARCKAELCRLVWPDRCAGMISSEEHADELGIDINAAIDAAYTERKSGGFTALPTNTNAPKVETSKLEPPAVVDTKPEQAAAPAPESSTPANEPLSDDDVAFIADDMKEAADEKDVKRLSSIAAEIAELGKRGRVNEAQRRYLLGVYKKCAEAIKAAKP